MYYVLSGSIAFPEIAQTAGPGRLFGEIGVFSPWKTRTALAVAQTDAVLLCLSDRQVADLYYQNPAFGLSVVRLVIEHLIAREGLAGAGLAEPAADAASGTVPRAAPGSPSLDAATPAKARAARVADATQDVAQP